MIKIGTASKDERGKYLNGTAGDQTGKEVYIREWYNFGYTTVLRCKDNIIAKKMTALCKAMCNNPYIGYDQNQRNTAYTQAKKVGYDLSKIAVPCETDCSASMTLCAICAGIRELEYTSNAPTTSTMINAFKKTGKFDILTENKYLNNDKYLKAGDILVKPGHHTVMALEDGALALSAGSGCTKRPLIKKGATDKSLGGEYVSSWQRFLSMTGFYSGKIDGKFGNEMLDAVKRYQTANNLIPDGEIGPKTWATIP